MARGLDHIAHAVRDLDAAADFYRRLGFTVGARNRHPPAWGTQNHIVQLPGFFIELLALADMSATAPHGPRYFSFGAFNRDFLARGQGLAMLALEGRGAPDAEEFRAAGIGDFELFDFEREGKAARRHAGQARVLAGLRPRPESARHRLLHLPASPSGELLEPGVSEPSPTPPRGVAGVVLVADNPSDHHIFLSAFAGERELLATSAGITVEDAARRDPGDGPGGVPRSFRHRRRPTRRDGARLAALRFAVRDLDCRRALLQAGHLHRRAAWAALSSAPKPRWARPWYSSGI